MNKINKAFSLIELSIVVLIIGILIAGVTQGSRMVQQARIKTAQNQTSSAAVSSIPGLVLWLEATTASNVVSATNGTDAENGDNVMGWNDINTQTLTKNNVSRATNNSNITYSTNAINGLPAVKFNGTAGTANSLNGALILTTANNFTLFIVSQSADNTSVNYRCAITNGTIGSNGFGYSKDSSNKRQFVMIRVVGGVGSSITTNPEIAAMSYYNTALSLFINGTQNTLTPSTATMLTPTVGLYIGNQSDGACAWQGLIGEIIMFDHLLKTSERKSIEDYLGKKWSITVAP
jgi:prepilin-type N-terminal cleavage/methylation domain-containing protein